MRSCWIASPSRLPHGPASVIAPSRVCHPLRNRCGPRGKNGAMALSSTVASAMTLTDGELLERWRGGDAASGEELFERYYDMVDRFFLNKVPTSVVPDLVQETFAGCVAGAERIKNHEQFRFYLFGIACNVLKAHIRQGYRGGQPLDLNESSMRDLAPGPVTLLVQRREHRLLLE